MSSLIGIGDAEELETAEGIKRMCQRINEREKQVNETLEALVSRKLNLESKIDSCFVKYQQLYKASMCEDTKKLSKVITHTSDLAEKVSAKVRNLDTARMRATEVQKRVHDLIGK